MSQLPPARIFTEIGLGNPNFISSEIELADGWEFRQPGFVRMRIKGVYLRLWFGRRVIILSTCNGLKFQRKERKTVKLLFGIQGVGWVSEMPDS